METNNAFDIADLGTQPIEDSGEYEAASDFYRPVEPGKETLILKEIPADEKFFPVKDFETQKVVPGFSFNGEWQVVGGLQDGKTFFAFLDTRKKQARNGNDVQDYVLALKAAGRPVGNMATYGDLKDIIQSQLAPVVAKITWQGDKCDCGAKRVKLRDFEPKTTGSQLRNHVAKCPGCGEKVGARAKISAIIVPDAS